MCFLGSHRWNGCKCAGCGKARSHGHDWSQGCERCSRCRVARPTGHNWDGCKCSTCDRRRNEGHDWSKDCERCSRCGDTREGRHDWDKNYEQCSHCGTQTTPLASEVAQLIASTFSDVNVTKQEIKVKGENGLMVRSIRRCLEAAGVNAGAVQGRSHSSLSDGRFCESWHEPLSKLGATVGKLCVYGGDDGYICAISFDAGESTLPSAV
jgi:hypothetical protein